MIRFKFPTNHKFSGYGIQTDADHVNSLNRSNVRVVSFKDKKNAFTLMQYPGYKLNGQYVSIYDLIIEVKQL